MFPESQLKEVSPPSPQKRCRLNRSCEPVEVLLFGDGSSFVPQGHTSFLEELFHF